EQVKLGLGKKEFASRTFVGLSRVKALAHSMMVGQLDYSRVKDLSGKNLQHRLDDFARR
ncbi:hypothetical protein R3P38DRAFT_2463871, partial [Favolaschia claudopus]